MPPFARCRLIPRPKGAILEFDGETPPLSLRILKEHTFSWNLEGRILSAPKPVSCWLPYDLNVIMRFGHSVNTAIPEDPDQAEFPPTPWGDNVMIRIKSQPPPVQPGAPLPAGDGTQEPSSVPGSPSAWIGPAVRQAPPISADAAALTDDHSPYDTKAAD
jgi:hypothetical protein